MAATGFVHPEFLIDTETLERQLGDPICASSTARPI